MVTSLYVIRLAFKVAGARGAGLPNFFGVLPMMRGIRRSCRAESCRTDLFVSAGTPVLPATNDRSCSSGIALLQSGSLRGTRTDRRQRGY